MSLAETAELIPGKTYTLWLPVMAQKGLMVIHTGDLYYSYPSAALDRFYQIRSHISNLPSKLESEDRLKGFEIEVEINVYYSEIESAKPESREKQFLPGYYNQIRKIDQKIFDSHKAGEFRRDATGSWWKKQVVRISNLVISMLLYHKKIKREEPPIKIIFKIEESLPNGLCRFATKSNTSKELSEFENDIYRQIKFHFHEDHFHDSEMIIAEPYVGTCSIKEDNNEALLYYITACHKLLTTTLHGLYQDYREIDIATEDVNRKRRRIVRRNKLKFYDKCHDLVGQWVFLRTLLTSPQNKCCKPEAYPSDKAKDYSLIARNIENVKEGVEALRNKIRHHHDERNLHAANRTNRLNTRLAWLSLSLGIISVALALLSFDEIKDDVFNWIKESISQLPF